MADDNAENQARAQAASIVEMVAALECDYDRLEELRDMRSDDSLPIDPKTGSPLTEEELEKLAELEAAAGDCTSQDEAQNRIQEDPLSVQIRSGWYSPGAEPEPEEFEVLLCTGGPAVRILGELDDNNQPYRAWIEYQDWGTPWTRLFDGIEQDTLLTYCQQFYFGE